MIKKIFSLALLFSTPMFSQVARDTIWVDSYDYISTKKDAESFKLAKPIKGNSNLQSIEVYNAKTRLIESKGNGVFQDGSATVLYQGDVKYYNKNGKVNATYTYDENNMITNSESIDPRNGKVYKCAYSDNNLYNGEAFYDWKGVYVYMLVEDGHYKEYLVINPKNDKNRVVYTFDENNILSAESYYDESGKVVHTGTYSEGQNYNGEFTLLNYDEFGILSISKYTDGVSLNTTSYYKNGKVKSTSVVKGNLTSEVYFDKNGKQLGTYSSKLEDDGYSTYQNGTLYYFNAYGTDPDEIYAIYHYKDNAAIKVEDFYVAPEKNTVKMITYNSEENLTLKKEYFTPDGKLKGQLVYDADGYTPKDGTDYADNMTTTYKNGKLVERVENYSNGKVFESTKNGLSVFYDMKGKEMGRVTFRDEPMYGTEVYISGTRYTIQNDLISDVSKYEKEALTYQGSYDNKEGKSVLSSETFYQNSNITKVVEYYSNGKKASIAIYSPSSYSYSPVKSTFFDNTGKELGSYDYVTQTGTLVEFSYDKQIISNIKYSNGNAISKKGYAQNQNSGSKYYLQSDIDYNKQGKFYNEKGELISTVSYKDGAPYTGTTYDSDSYYITEATYNKGVKIGKETVKYLHSDEIVNINHYDNEGELTKVETYTNNTLESVAEYHEGLQHGTTTYYNSEGEVLSTLIYNGGVPYEGTLTTIDYSHYTTVDYKDGVITSKKISTLDDSATAPLTLVLEEVYQNETTFKRTINDAETGKTIFKYGVKDNDLDGQYQYYENGKVKYQATLKEGILTDGTIAINDLNYSSYNYYSDNSSKYTVLTNKKGNFTVKVYDENNKELFKMEAKVKKGDSSLNPLTSNKITLDNLFPSNEFNVPSYYGAYDYAVEAAATAVDAAADAAMAVPAAEAYYE
ncbi:hypothetical protein HX017_01775 [Myroides marinus]|uniref:hypothetical protein n=1 Tax=Myroides marinus TaxID=703342 RepID=UPI002578B26B|nr:hypothetical protein [Myroides marinus]MDM1345851.1 hypothetical protein [Myroides marinus]MDM1349288.1 hypothetical protein [Myroides marinus]MDM1353034.1 hypothetical protein [Myroides marinus]MDM1356498.1 hypothetical protein [Myroides marinus]MDM1360858.1 hypothetical protein [Myroides marinus]